MGQLKHEPPAPVNPESPRAPACFTTLPTELKNKIYGYTLEAPKRLPHISEALQRLPQILYSHSGYPSPLSECSASCEALPSFPFQIP
ncbi:uncharacterized protein K444DRAFT_613734 [Hyaloscypha bicolor E]|uniref:Uncharacterized protein n=1 Tax=Hyaloscypha bicolor E TaxID=1095630 RepID=A0A2J6T7E7_9HELO|nr:uncharacterized protein K444DRAFT_613734 [Hyaloscypha bicolor E]PMD58937.1 hypothetical protein K444DRAFT_613734 [Hyaloscypha bicolor E]